MSAVVYLELYRKILIYILILSALLGSFKIISFFKAFIKNKKIKETDKKGKYAIVIPARNESRVIEGLLKSIQNQNYDLDLIDLYIVMQDENDPTVEIAKKYNADVSFVKSKTKSEALDYVFKKVLKEGKKYDAFFIMDADNIMSKNFIKEMNKSYQEGFHVGVGFRNNKEWNNGVVSACSALTFFMINTMQNKPNNNINTNMVVSGTGFYISYEMIKNFGGWPFTTLTEDYELSTYCTINDIKIKYVEEAEFFDEQPTSFKVSYVQRLRWIKGYLQVHEKYKNDLNESSKGNFKEKLKTKIGVWPFIIALSSIAIYIVLLLGTSIIGFFIGMTNRNILINEIGRIIIVIYLAVVIFSFILFILDRKRINIKLFNMIKACFFNPIFLGAYIPLIIKAALVEKVEWVPIEHNINKDNYEK